MQHMALGKTYYVETYGCQMNAHESEKIAGILEELGYAPAAEEQADILILNTCCIRDSAEQRIIGRLGTLKKRKAANPRICIGVVGCLPQQEGAQARLRRSFPFLDIILGTQDLGALREALGAGTPVYRHADTAVLNENVNERDQIPMRRGMGPAAYVNIMYGCNNYCSYCIVPYVRGPERSRDAGRVIREIQALQENGFREITLLGQNVNSYSAGMDFAGLLDRILAQTDIPRIRFMTSHPKDLSDRLIDRMACHSRLCPHIHLPLQSGSDAVLQSMNRRYTAAQFLRLTERIRSAVPEVAITTDLIVGYPGETEQDFLQTMEMVGTIQFDAAYTFVYSPRKGTAAAAMAAQIPKETKKERITALISRQNAITYARNAVRVGRVEEVLVTGPSRRDPRQLTGRTPDAHTVNFDGTPDLVGKIVPVRITQAKRTTLSGRLEEETEWRS